MAEGKEGEGDKGKAGGSDAGGKEGGEGSKGTIPQARLDAEVARRHKAEKELADIKKAAEDKDKKALEDQNEFKKLYEGVAPKVKRADDLESSLKEYLAEEVADLSDEQKALIPEGAPESQLKWVKKAKKAGVFGKQETPGTFNGKPNGKVPPDKWYLELDASDQKFASLTSAQYLEWKTHNRKSESRMVPGGF